MSLPPGELPTLTNTPTVTPPVSVPDDGVVRPPILLITLCSWRADHLATYGYARSTTPHFDRFASSAVVFEQSWTNATYTDAAHASLFTGLYPGHSGMLDFGDTLSPSAHTLAEIVGLYGYRTMAVVDRASNFGPRALDGIGRGFSDRYQVEPDNMVAGISRWIAADSSPWLVWVHLRRAHAPYGPGPPFTEAADPAIRAWLGSQGAPPTGTSPIRDLQHELSARPDLLNNLRDLYDSGLQHADAQLGALLDGLDGSGLLDKALVVIAGDHGEGLESPTQLGHQGFLIAPVLRVPIVIRAPDRVGRRVPQTMSLVDLLPTLAELASVPPPARLDGVSVAAALRGEPVTPHPVLAQAVRAQKHLQATAPQSASNTPPPGAAEAPMKLDQVWIDLPYWLGLSPEGLWTLWQVRADNTWVERTYDDPPRLDRMVEAAASAAEGSSFREVRPTMSDAERDKLRRDGYW